MAVRIHDGKLMQKGWERRRLEDWEDDVRWNTEEKPELVSHPIVEQPPKWEKDGLSYSKAWQAQFWDDYGRVAGEDVTLEECGRKEAIMCRNIGGRSSYQENQSGRRWKASCYQRCCYGDRCCCTNIQRYRYSQCCQGCYKSRS